jgi:hypothetical protein
MCGLRGDPTAPVLMFAIKVRSRYVHILGITAHPDYRPLMVARSQTSLSSAPRVPCGGAVLPSGTVPPSPGWSRVHQVHPPADPYGRVRARPPEDLIFLEPG